MPTSQDHLVEQLFKETLNQLKTLELTKKSPSIFLMYAHDNPKKPGIPADAIVAREIIHWLCALKLNIDSDMSWQGSDSAAKEIDIPYNQISIVPGHLREKDFIILCGSKLLTNYLEFKEGELYINYYTRVSRAIDASTNTKYKPSLNPDLLKANIELELKEIKSHETEFHHLVTELAFLNVRVIKKPESIISILLNGDEQASLPFFISKGYVYNGTFRWRKPGQYAARQSFTDEGLYLGFFQLLERLFIKDFEIRKCIAYHKELFIRGVQQISDDKFTTPSAIVEFLEHPPEIIVEYKATLPPPIVVNPIENKLKDSLYRCYQAQ